MAVKGKASRDSPKITRRKRPSAYFQVCEVPPPLSPSGAPDHECQDSRAAAILSTGRDTETLSQPELVLGHQIGSPFQGVRQEGPSSPEQLP